MTNKQQEVLIDLLATADPSSATVEDSIWVTTGRCGDIPIKVEAGAALHRLAVSVVALEQRLTALEQQKKAVKRWRSDG